MMEQRQSTCILKLFFFLFVFCGSWPVIGQQKQKLAVTPADYHKWGILEFPTLSPKGKWASYHMRYEHRGDTLFVRSADAKKTYTFPEGRKEKFCGDTWHGCLVGKTLCLTELATGKTQRTEKVSGFEFSANGHFVIYQATVEDGKKALTILSLSTGERQSVENSTSWQVDSKRKLVACTTQKADGSDVLIYELAKKVIRKGVFSLADAVAAHFSWQPNSASFACMLLATDGKAENTKIAKYRLTDSRLFVFDPRQTEDFPVDKTVSQQTNSLKVSDDGQQVFFLLAPVKPVAVNNTDVEVWRGDDRLLQSERKWLGNFDDWPKAAAWQPETDSFFSFMHYDTSVLLSGDQKFALTSSIAPCEMQFTRVPQRTYYITNLITGQRKVWMQCHSGYPQHTYMAAGGGYIAYYNGRDWFSYNLETEKHINLTQNLGTAFYDEANDIMDAPEAYGILGWTNDKHLLLYDRFDLWEINSDGSGAKRLTHGRENGIRYRAVKPDSTKLPQWMARTESLTIDLNLPLCLKLNAQDYSTEGYAILERGTVNLKRNSKHHIRDLHKVAETDAYAYLIENADTPPSLVLDREGAATLPFYQSNPQHNDYAWGKREVLYFSNGKGEKLKGLLYYPANYLQGKKYPMVVKIYSILSESVHYYRNPTNMSNDGYNAPHLAGQGYFVLEPDISYTMGEPGLSAVDCVESAVKAVLKMGIIDPNKIGLIGHSFGGFESSFIITQSKLFAAAVAGSAQTDNVSGYFTIGGSDKKAEHWRYEYYQNRMGKTPFEDLNGYVANSSVHQSKNANSPLLIWTGNDDGTVSATQSMALYLALRRRNKPVVMLRYPEEDHSIEKPRNQIDLGQRIDDWFGHYLKSMDSKPWMKLMH